MQIRIARCDSYGVIALFSKVEHQPAFECIAEGCAVVGHIARVAVVKPKIFMISLYVDIDAGLVGGNAPSVCIEHGDFNLDNIFFVWQKGFTLCAKEHYFTPLSRTPESG